MTRNTRVAALRQLLKNSEFRLSLSPVSFCCHCYPIAKQAKSSQSRSAITSGDTPEILRRMVEIHDQIAELESEYKELKQKL